MKKSVLFYSVLISLLLFQSCANSNKLQKSENTFWVSGIKVETSNGAGKSENFLINKSEDYKKGTWQNFYNNIDSFNYEDGYMKKITVQTKELNKNEVPADASTLQYTLVKEIDKVADNRALLNGDWTLVKLNNNPINRMLVLPTLTIQTNKMTLFGNDGCNNYSASIGHLTTDSITLKPIISTLKACIEKNMATEYYTALQTVVTYKIDATTLQIINNQNQTVLTFLRNEKNKNIDGNWTAVKINGNPINKMNTAPTLFIDIKNNTITGNNSCNGYNGKIIKQTAVELQLGPIATTKKMCFNNEVEEKYNVALSKVKSYKIIDNQLVFLDENGSELIAFIK